MWTPIGDDGWFNGIFDGNGHTVSGVYINNEENNQGLFGECNGTIKNVGVIDSYIHGSGYVGGVAGNCDNGSIIDNCYNTGTVSGEDYVGGVVGYCGYNGSTVVSCYNTGNVSGGDFVGGIIGYCKAGITLRNCRNTGTVSGSDDVGGIVGCAYSTVTNCYNTGTVSGSNVGGVVGSAHSTVTDCYNTGTVSGKDDIGGAVGFSYHKTVENCYYLAGCGTNLNEFGQQLSRKQLSNKDSFENWNFNNTWEIGYRDDYDYPTLRCFGSRIYYNRIVFTDGDNILSDELRRNTDTITVSALPHSEYDFAYYEDENGNRYYEGDTITFDKDMTYAVIWVVRNVSENVWDGTYDTDWSGSGTSDDPYLIETPAHFGGLMKGLREGNRYENLYFRQTQDILLNDGAAAFAYNVEGKNQWALGRTPEFYGYYDGSGYSVSGIYIKALKDGSVSLFGNIGHINRASGAVKNLTIIDSYIYTYNGTVAVIAGENYGSIENCRTSETVKLTGGSISGICTSNFGTISVCENRAALDATGYINYSMYGSTVSGITESNKGGILGCSNYGELTGDYVGGIAYQSYSNGDESIVVTGCNNYGVLIGENVGGILCKNDGYVAECNNFGAVSGTYVGGIASISYSDSYGFERYIINCRNYGVLTGDNVSGIAWENEGYITDCINEGALSGTRVYGISGYNARNNITGCINAGVLSGKTVAGIVGNNRNCGIVMNCANIGELRGGDVSGIAYSNKAVIRSCYNSGDGNGEYSASGISASNNGTVTDCYNAGDISASEFSEDIYTHIGFCAGIAEYNRGVIENCYNIGSVYGTREVSAVSINFSENSVVNCYYLGVDGATDANAVALTESQMRQKESFAGFDFDAVWTIDSSADYPYPTLVDLKHEEPPVEIFTVTFTDDIGNVISEQEIEDGEAATAPDMSGYLRSEGDYVYTFDHWEGDYGSVKADITIKAVMRRTEVIRFLGTSVPVTVEYGYSRDELTVLLESLFAKKLFTTTNGYKMSCEVIWSADDISDFNSGSAGTYTITGRLKITDPEYSSVAAFYRLADGERIEVKVTVLPKGESGDVFVSDDLQYTTAPDGTLTLTGYSGNAADIRIPATVGGAEVTAIADGAFRDNTTVRTVSGSVKNIGNAAFRGCSSLVQVILEEGVQNIGADAFADTALVSATIPQSVTAIGDRAFGFWSDGRMIDGFRLYAYPLSGGIDYAVRSGIPYSEIKENGDESTGIKAVVEVGLTVVAEQVEDGSYFENAVKLISETEKLALYDIRLTDLAEPDIERQPGNIVSISIPVPGGFDGGMCKVYRINSDGSYKDMNARLIDGRLVFETAHLSHYAVISQRPEPSVVESVTSTSVTLRAKEGYEYRCNDGGWQTEPVFVGLEPDTEYRFYQRLAAAMNMSAGECSEATVVRTEAGEPPYVPVKGIRFDRENVEMRVGEESVLKVIFIPENPTYKNLKWYSTDRSVVRVSDGVITAVGTGVAKISAISVNGGFVAECTVTVTDGGATAVPVEGIALDRQSVAMKTGDAPLTLGVIFTPEGATNKNVTWQSSDESVVTVDGGVITAVGAGVATVTVISEDGGFRAECTVTVEASLAAGDTNGDGVVNVKDLVRLMRYITDNSIEIFSADVNGDGKVDTKDLVRLMKIIAASK